MRGIFISYRREDTAGYAGRLYDRLASHFGPERVFMDVEGIEPGVDFVEAIEQAVASCEVLIVLIGNGWLAADGAGKRRLDDPADFVRIETGAALARGIRVVPVLVEGATMPRAGELPPELAALVRRQAVEMSHKHWDAACDELIRTLERVLAAGKEPGRAATPADSAARMTPGSDGGSAAAGTGGGSTWRHWAMGAAVAFALAVAVGTFYRTQTSAPVHTAADTRPPQPSPLPPPSRPEEPQAPKAKAPPVPTPETPPSSKPETPPVSKPEPSASKAEVPRAPKPEAPVVAKPDTAPVPKSKSPPVAATKSAAPAATGPATAAPAATASAAGAPTTAPPVTEPAATASTAAAPAATAPAPATSAGLPRVGDVWEYRFRGAWKTVEPRTYTHQVTMASDREIRESMRADPSPVNQAESKSFSPVTRFVEWRGKGYYFLEFNPYLEAFGGLPKPGTTWKLAGMPPEDPNFGNWNSQARVVDWGSLSLPLGTFRTLRIEITSTRVATGSVSMRATEAVRVLHAIWYAPEVKRTVKVVRTVYSATGLRLDEDTWELVKYRVQ